MASIAKEKNGHRRIQFCHPDGRRPTIRLGKVSQRAAESFKLRVECLLASMITGHPLDAETSRWIAELPENMIDKLVRAGLIPNQKPAVKATLGAFIENYIERRVDVSPHTRRIWRQTARRLVEHFGADKLISEITRGEAADWRLSLVGEGLADASIRNHCGFAKHFLAQAVDHELTAVNPFGKLVSAPVGNESRQFFVTREMAAKVIAACPDAEWRLMFVMSRFGGLRCPSEHLELTWDDINWDQGKMLVTSPKTARHPGHETRVVPLFAELVPYLNEVWDASDPGTHVFTRYRNPGGNLRTQLARIVRRAGLKPWPRIWHNLRASRATELAAEFPAHVAAVWLGHSTLVAQKHYWQVTNDDFERASGRGAQCGAPAAHNPAQRVNAENRGKSSAWPENNAEQGLVPRSTNPGESVRNQPTEVHGNRTHLPNGLRTAQRF